MARGGGEFGPEKPRGGDESPKLDSSRNEPSPRRRDDVILREYLSLVTRENCNHLDDDYLLYLKILNDKCLGRERQLLSPFPYHRLNGSSGVYRRIHLLESARYIVVPAAHRTYNWLTPGNKVSRGSSFRYLRNEQAPGDIVTITSSLDTYPLFEVLFTH